MTTQPCKRCLGNGYLEITLGLAGQDPREIGQSNMKWSDKYPRSVCSVCDGHGTTTKHSKQQRGPISKQIPNSDHHINSIQCN